MKGHQMPTKSSRFWFSLIPGLLIVTTAVMLQSLPNTEAANGDATAATYSKGSLRLTIPYQAPHAGDGQLTVELLNPEDKVLAHLERPVAVDAGRARWHEELKLEEPLAIEDLVWHRLRYRFTYSNSKDAAVAGAESLSQILTRGGRRDYGQGVRYGRGVVRGSYGAG